MTSYEIHMASAYAAVAHLSPAITMIKAMSFLGFPCIYSNVFSLSWNWYGMTCLQNVSRVIKTSTFITVLTIIVRIRVTLNAN